jgi:CheY-like chemotaxis protein
MTPSGRDVLLVGRSFQTAHSLIHRLRQWGYRCHFAGTMRTAWRLLSFTQIDVVLSDIHLSDGTGVDMLGILAGLPITAFLCLPVETSCFWLPAIDAGKKCLGLPALRPSELANALEGMSHRPALLHA